MQHDPDARLVMMANQIAKFFAAQGEKRAVPAIANHLKKYWEPRMRDTIKSYVGAGGTGLDPLALQAVKKLDTDITGSAREEGG